MKRRIFDWAASPMCITESAFRALVAKVATIPEPKLAAGAEDLDDLLEEFYGPPAIHEEAVGPVRVIHVTGVIDRFVPSIWRKLGYVDVELLQERVEAAMADETVTGIVLAMNTPGGSVWGTAEAAAAIAEASKQKPVVVHAANLLASGGYWLAAGASAIVADPTAEIGSVGVYTPMWDFQGWYESMGMSVELAKTGGLKGAGYPGTAWTDEQRKHEQEVVDDYFAAFKAHIAAHRSIAGERLTGGCYVAPRALSYGFIDALGTLDSAMVLAADLGASLKQTTIK